MASSAQGTRTKNKINNSPIPSFCLGDTGVPPLRSCVDGWLTKLHLESSRSQRSVAMSFFLFYAVNAGGGQGEHCINPANQVPLRPYLAAPAVQAPRV
jgi:hypothetical protein